MGKKNASSTSSSFSLILASPRHVLARYQAYTVQGMTHNPLWAVQSTDK